MIEIRENMQCIVCNTTTFISTSHPRVWECVKCQIWVTDPQPTDLELKKFYSEGYFKKRENGGLKITKTFTYGSGFTERENMSIFYKIAKKIFDFLAKFRIDDNIVLELQKL